MPGMVLGDVASRHRLYLAAKRSHVGVNVNGLACPYSHQMRGQGFLSGVVLSYHCSGRWHLFGRCEASGLGYLVEC
jgi:hypothetical protein